MQWEERLDLLFEMPGLVGYGGEMWEVFAETEQRTLDFAIFLRCLSRIELFVQGLRGSEDDVCAALAIRSAGGSPVPAVVRVPRRDIPDSQRP